MSIHHGSCLCGAISFSVAGPLRDVIICHCTQCRKSSGHVWAATQADTTDIKIDDPSSLIWFRSSASAERGFCATCGSSLFWRTDGATKTSIGAGCLDATGLSTAKHIYVNDKGDYYDIADGLPQL